MALSSPLLGALIDRVGVRRPYIISLIGYGCAGGAALVVNSYWPLLLSRAVLGVFLAGVFAAVNVLILSYYEGIERNKVMGWRGSAQSLGGIVWPLVGGALGTLSWRLPFSVYLVAIPLGLLAMTFIREPVASERQPSMYLWPLPLQRGNNMLTWHCPGHHS